MIYTIFALGHPVLTSQYGKGFVVAEGPTQFFNTFNNASQPRGPRKSIAKTSEANQEYYITRPSGLPRSTEARTEVTRVHSPGDRWGLPLSAETTAAV